MSENCISCGMPLRSVDERAGKDPAKNYCVHCARPNGELKSYDEVLAGMSAFLARTQGIAESVARKSAEAMMAKMPAWRK